MEEKVHTLAGQVSNGASHRSPIRCGDVKEASKLQARIDHFRISEKFDLALNPVFARLDKSQKRWSDSSEDPETSLFGFARMPPIADAVSGKRHEEMKLELQERADAIALLRSDDLALGTVVKVLGDALHVRLDRVAEWLPREGRARTLRRLPEELVLLDVRGVVPASELQDDLRADQLVKALSHFRPGDALVMVITKVEPHSDYIGLSMRQSRIDERLSRLIVLGECRNTEHIRTTWGLGASRVESRFQRDFQHVIDKSHAKHVAPESASSHNEGGSAGGVMNLNELLQADALFGNPYALDHMMDSFGISQEARLFGMNARRPPLRGYMELRRLQNTSWAQDSVRKGVQHASDRNYALAIKCYQSAINLDPKNADAHVALGAAFANTSKYQQALKELETALDIDPTHVNAKRYLEATRNKVRETLGPLADMVLGAKDTKIESSGGRERRVPEVNGDKGDVAAEGGVRCSLALQAERGKIWAQNVMLRQQTLSAQVPGASSDASHKKKKDKKDKKSKKKKDKRRKREKKGKKSKASSKRGKDRKRKRDAPSSRSSASSSNDSGGNASSSASARSRASSSEPDERADGFKRRRRLRDEGESPNAGDALPGRGESALGAARDGESVAGERVLGAGQSDEAQEEGKQEEGGR